MLDLLFIHALAATILNRDPCEHLFAGQFDSNRRHRIAIFVSILEQIVQ